MEEPITTGWHFFVALDGGGSSTQVNLVNAKRNLALAGLVALAKERMPAACPYEIEWQKARVISVVDGRDGTADYTLDIRRSESPA